jgi:hypothetical protein
MKRQQKDQVGQLFTSLIEGRFDEFASGCAPDLIVTVRGSSPVPTTLTRSDIPDWYGSLQALSPTSLESTVEIGRFEGATGTVLLRHAFSRHGVDYLLEMVNLVTFRDGLLAEWSSYPLNLPEYARAWRTYDHSMLAAV